MSTVLVTGGSGFIGSHCILQLLAAGHTVRTTVRTLSREAAVRDLLKVGGAEPGENLRFFGADLLSDAGWPEAVAGCDYVLHVASPFPPEIPKDENDLIVPAREGSLRALRASRDAGVKRVVLTSSFAAIGYGHPQQDAPFDETYWTNLDGRGVLPYVKSKTIAERAAWEFMAREGGALELAVVNPVGVFGPALGPDTSTSILIVQGERFLAVAGDFLTMLEMAAILRARLGDAGKKAPTTELPNWLLRFVSLFDARVKQVLPELGVRKNATNEKARRVLGWKPRSNEECIVAAAESLVRLGVIKVPAK